MKSPRANGGGGQILSGDQDDGLSSTSSSQNITSDRLSKWCQDFLELDDSGLDSLWYERLAEFNMGQGRERYDIVVSLYQQALAKDNPSWVCHRGLALVYSEQGENEEAIMEGEAALQQAQLEDANPKAKPEEVHELRIILASYNFKAGKQQRAAELYLTASNSEILEQANRAKLGYLEVRLRSSDAEEAREYLRSILLVQEEDKMQTFVHLLKLAAWGIEDDSLTLLLRIFTIAKSDSDILRSVLCAMELATSKKEATKEYKQENAVLDSVNEDSFNEDTARGVILFLRGMAAYKYGTPPEGTQAIAEARRLWNECLEVLSNVGGRNAFVARQGALVSLAKHYFNTMADGNHLEHIDELVKLGDVGSMAFFSDAVGFLGALYALRGEKEQARTVLRGRIERGLQILWDDDPQNDVIGFSAIYKTLLQYQDFKGAAISFCLLGQPDLVGDALKFEEKDMPSMKGAPVSRLLVTVERLAKETIEISRAKFPDTTQQSQRISAAKAHVENLLRELQATHTEMSDSSQIAHQTELGAPADDQPAQTEDGNDQGQVSDFEIMSQALDLLLWRINPISQTHTPHVDINALQWSWGCDGLRPDGTRCTNRSGFDNEFYHCIFCSDRDFCWDCLLRLRAPSGLGTDDVEILACSRKHKWLRIPRQGDSIWVGRMAKKISAGVEIKWTDDESILELGLGGSEGDIEIENWKKALAEEWEIVRT